MRNGNCFKFIGKPFTCQKMGSKPAKIQVPSTSVKFPRIPCVEHIKIPLQRWRVSHLGQVGKLVGESSHTPGRLQLRFPIKAQTQVVGLIQVRVCMGDKQSMCQFGNRDAQIAGNGLFLDVSVKRLVFESVG